MKHVVAAVGGAGARGRADASARNPVAWTRPAAITRMAVATTALAGARDRCDRVPTSAKPSHR
jgi:hypothetical protein